MSNLEELENKIGFKIDKDILRLSLTHKSTSTNNNDKLEFLGDAILEFIISKYLFGKFKQSNAGDLSRIRAYIVSQDYLTSIAISINLDKYIILGKGETLTGGKDKPSILSSTLEALIAAIYVSNGIEDTETFIERIFNLENILFETNENYKGIFQSYSLKLFKVIPYYITELYNNHYQSKVFIDETFYGKGRGNSKKSAEINAAKDALTKLKLL